MSYYNHASFPIHPESCNTQYIRLQLSLSLLQLSDQVLLLIVLQLIPCSMLKSASLKSHLIEVYLIEECLIEEGLIQEGLIQECLIQRCLIIKVEGAQWQVSIRNSYNSWPRGIFQSLFGMNDPVDIMVPCIWYKHLWVHYTWKTIKYAFILPLHLEIVKYSSYCYL